MNEIENLNIDELHRPKTPAIIFRIDIIENPFKDLFPRDVKWDNNENVQQDKYKDIVVQSKPLTILKKRLKMESSESEDENSKKKLKIKSSHDVLADKHLLRDAVDLKQIKNIIQNEENKNKRSETGLMVNPQPNNHYIQHANTNNIDNETTQNIKADVDRQTQLLKDKIYKLNKKNDDCSVS